MLPVVCGKQINNFPARAVLVDVVGDGHDQFFDIAEYAVAEPLLGEVTEETLDHVEPRAAEAIRLDRQGIRCSGKGQGRLSHMQITVPSRAANPPSRTRFRQHAAFSGMTLNLAAICCNLPILHSTRSQQVNPRSLHAPRRSTPGARTRLQHVSLLGTAPRVAPHASSLLLPL
jgi:hypothetical protein